MAQEAKEAKLLWSEANLGYTAGYKEQPALQNEMFVCFLKSGAQWSLIIAQQATQWDTLSKKHQTGIVQ